MNQPIIYQLRAKISQAHIQYYNSDAKANGAVLAQVFSGFILQCHSTNPRKRITFFLQIPLCDSREGRTRGTGGITYSHCVRGADGSVIIENITPAGGYPLPFHSQRGPLRHLTYKLNGFLRQVLAHPPTFRESNGAVHRLVYTAREKNLKNWTLNSMYVGLETENRDFRPSSPNHAPQGTVTVALQLAGLSVISEAPPQARHLAK